MYARLVLYAEYVTYGTSSNERRVVLYKINVLDAALIRGNPVPYILLLVTMICLRGVETTFKLVGPGH